MNTSTAMTPVVLVHGIRLSSSMWQAQLAAVEATGRPVIAVDLPGHGTRADEVFTIDAAVAVVDAAVQRLGGRAVVVGLSLGGYVAIAYAGRFTGSVAGLVAADCSTEPVGIGARTFEVVAGAIGQLPDHGERLNHLVLDRILPDDGAREAAAGGFSPVVVSSVVEALRTTDPRADLARLEVPVWLINGELDPFRLQEREFLRACANGRLEIIRGAGHMSNLIAPVQFTRLLLEALDQVDAGHTAEPGERGMLTTLEDAAPAGLRIRLDLAYDGTDFAGWAVQPGLRTVQGVIEEALATVLRLPEPPRLTVAGRTDAGVHARAQVAHVDVPAAEWAGVVGRGERSPGVALVSRLAGVLPNDVVVHRAAEAPSGFDARFSALHRRYSYRISDRVETRDPLRRSQVLWRRRELDVAAMDDAARRLLGEHDFGAYCRPREGATTVRTLQLFGWARLTAGADAGLVVATVQADAFCHSMVRALVGASIAVGEGRRDAPWPLAVLVSGKRDPAGAVAPAHGLTLDEITYPPPDALASRARLARAVRRLTTRP